LRTSLLLLSALPSLALVAPTIAAPLEGQALGKAVDRYSAAMVQRGDLSGQLLILRQGRVVLERNWGMASAELRSPVTPRTRFNIASVTKPLTVTLATQLIEEHRLATSDSIARWFPSFPKGDSITIDMLLNHRAGIPHRIIPDSESTRPFTAEEIVERAARLPLDFPPGSREQYSSGGYEVLARVLELASGKRYGDLLRERILDPLGMRETANADSRELLAGRAVGYSPGAHGLENAPLQDFSALVGAGSVWSTAGDMHKFVDAVVHGRLGAEARESWVRSGRLNFNGRTGGFKAWAMWDSTSGVEAIFLGNVSTGAPDALKSDLMRILAGETLTPPSLPDLANHPPSAEDIARMLGTYRLENGVTLRILHHDGALWSNDWVLLPTRDGGYFSPRDYGVIRGVAGPDGRYARLDWVQTGVTYPAPRVAGD
jgi:CubicO group peptidase (beta-lactamase class C family)